jgi:hypothetical protein
VQSSAAINLAARGLSTDHALVAGRRVHSYVAGLTRKKAGNVRPAADGAAFVQPPFTSTMFIYLNQVRRVRERAGRFACGFLSSKTIRI